VPTVSVFFWLVLYLPDKPPIPYHDPVPMTLTECLSAEIYFLTRPTDGVLLNGGRLEASCVIAVAPSENH
jgi:hypothetical protein